MSTPLKRMPKYRLHKADGRAVVTINGQDVWLGKHGTGESRQRYERAIAEWLRRRADPTPVVKKSDISINEIIAQFWKHVQRFYRHPDGSETNEVDNYRQALRPPPERLARLKVKGGRGAKDLRRETPAEWRKRLGEKGWAELRKWIADHRWHPHQLRHSAATRLRREYGLEAAQVILGHKTLTVTQVYAEKNVEAAARIMSEVG